MSSLGLHTGWSVSQVSFLKFLDLWLLTWRLAWTPTGQRGICWVVKTSFVTILLLPHPLGQPLSGICTFTLPPSARGSLLHPVSGMELYWLEVTMSLKALCLCMWLHVIFLPSLERTCLFSDWGRVNRSCDIPGLCTKMGAFPETAHLPPKRCYPWGQDHPMAGETALSSQIPSLALLFSFKVAASRKIWIVWLQWFRIQVKC